ncbi:hypothetical protein [Bradyrhizobium sp.]|uniref:hypothetical protein n=1 Tax=Bradyrhizobium sp. TaxID=376 RepID=UPI003C6515EF
MLRYAIALAICLVANSTRAQQASPPAATEPSQAVVLMEEPQPGDHWTYEIHDEITGKISDTRENVVTEVTQKNISLRFKMVGTSNMGLDVYDRSWNLLSAPNWRYSPYQGSTGVSAPLEVGKNWSFQSNNINSNNGAIWKETGTSKVVGREALTTKAGTFDTFKIETSLTIQSVTDVTKKNEVVFQTWYAPAIDHFVKRNIVSRINKHLRRNDTLELVEYGRKQ